MNILITGAKGMVGTALVANLKNIKENKNRTRPNLKIEDIYEYDLDSTYEELEEYKCIFLILILSNKYMRRDV